MAHIRQLLRDDIKTAVTGLATTGNNVFQSRVNPLSAPKLPCLLIYTEDESIQYSTVSYPRTQQRSLSVKIEAYVKGVTNYDNNLDTICSEIEQALYNDVTRSGLAKDTRVVAFSADYSGDGDQPVACGILTIEVIYTTVEGSPTN